MLVASRQWPVWLPHLICTKHECPSWNSVKFKPAELHPLDGLLSMFALRPVRCMFCWRRFYWFAFHTEN
jgi:hypothetical protein